MKSDYHNGFLNGNEKIEATIKSYYESPNKETLATVLETIRQRMHQNGHLLIPVMPQEKSETIETEEEQLIVQHIEAKDGKQWLAAFTSQKEVEKGQKTAILSTFIDVTLKGCKEMEEEGIIINPWGRSFLLTKGLIQVILNADKPKNQICFDLGDITRLEVDAIVNAANSSLLGGGGVDGAIHRAAGPGLLEECRKLHGCRTGEAKITGGWLLKAKYVIHTVGPIYDPNDPQCAKQLRDCYLNSLELAKQYDLHTIAFPAISTGVYGYPKQETAFIACKAVTDWLSENEEYGMAVIFNCYDQKILKTYQNVVDACASGKEKQ